MKDMFQIQHTADNKKIYFFALKALMVALGIVVLCIPVAVHMIQQRTISEQKSVAIAQSAVSDSTAVPKTFPSYEYFETTYPTVSQETGSHRVTNNPLVVPLAHTFIPSAAPVDQFISGENKTNSIMLQSSDTLEPPFNHPTSFPSSNPSSSATQTVEVTYFPGDLSVFENGLRLSRGLKSRVIAETGRKVRYQNGTKSTTKFHARPDGAAVFQLPDGQGWVYVSNSESTSAGGVGAITFDSDGSVVKYEMILTGTIRNCQGGKTPWNTWVSCEENEDKGQCWECDPFGKRTPRKTYLGGDGGNYESVACDYRDPYNPVFFVTNDKEDGELRRFSPSSSVVNASMNGGDEWDILSTPGMHEYLVLYPNKTKGRGGDGGTYKWTKSLNRGRKAAAKHFRKCEGMDIMDGKLYFVSSTQRELFVLDLDNNTYRKTSTFSKHFSGKPDGLKMGINGTLYFAEERDSNRNAGIYGRDLNGKYFTVLDATRLRGDATGIAFSPSSKHMYLAYQKNGKVFEVTREDGGSFHANYLDLRHHIRRD